MTPFWTTLRDLAVAGMLTPDKSRVNWTVVGTIVSGFSLTALQLAAILKGREFSPESYGIGVSLIFAGGAVDLLTHLRGRKAEKPVEPIAEPDQ